MGQVTIYLEEEVETKIIKAAESANLSKSEWIAQLIQEKIAREWPQSVVDMAGSWNDFPEADELRANQGQDAARDTD